MEKENKNLTNQDYGNIFDKNHPSEIEAYHETYHEDGIFTLLFEPEKKSREYMEQQELERLQRRELFVKLAEAAKNFKSPAKSDAKTFAQNNQELQIAIAESLSGQENSEEKFNNIVGIFESDSIPNFAKHFLSFNIIHPNPKEEFIEKNPTAETLYTKDKLMKESEGIDLMSFGLGGMSARERQYAFQGIKSPTLQYLLKDNEKQNYTGDSHRIVPDYKLVIYKDLLKCELGSSGNLTENFVQNIRYGEDLMLKILDGKIDVDKDISTENKAFLNSLITQLDSIYSQTVNDKKSEENKEIGLKERIVDIIQKIKPTSRYDLSDRLVRMFFYLNGIKSADGLLQTIKEKREFADAKNRKAENHLDLNENDLIKLIKPEFLPTTLENGILAKEYLGIGAKSDYTPMDIDFYGYRKSEYGTLKEQIFDSIGWYSSLEDEYIGVNEDNFCMLVVRKDDEFEETSSGKYNTDSDKYELFFQGVFLDGDSDYSPGEFEGCDYNKITDILGCKRDFGVRTGLPSSKIDAVIVPSKEKGREVIDVICNNPFYIPVYNIDGNMVLSPKEYDEKSGLLKI